MRPKSNAHKAWLKSVLEQRANTLVPEDQHYVSLGAGVQSSTLALMAARGQIGPMRRAAIFADTKAEPKAVYRWLDYLDTQLPFPIYRVTAGSLRDATLEPRVNKQGLTHFPTAIPFFTVDAEGTTGMLTRRTCTADYKIAPINTALRILANVKRGTKAPALASWIGISLEEATQRMKPAPEPWIANRWPLVECEMTREDCLAWMSDHGYPTPPRSACVFCPFRSNSEWRHLKDTDPDGFHDAVLFDKQARAVREGSTFTSTVYLHMSGVPLDRVDFQPPTTQDPSPRSWDDECSGVCGV